MSQPQLWPSVKFQKPKFDSYRSHLRPKLLTCLQLALSPTSYYSAGDADSPSTMSTCRSGFSMVNETLSVFSREGTRCFSLDAIPGLFRCL